MAERGMMNTIQMVILSVSENDTLLHRSTLAAKGHQWYEFQIPLYP